MKSSSLSTVKTTGHKSSAPRRQMSAFRAVAELRRRLQVRAREWGVGEAVTFRDFGTESFMVDIPLPQGKRDVVSIRAVNAHKVRFNYAGATVEVEPHDCETIIDAMDVGFEGVAETISKGL